jgi:class 3 adenylate cyclase
MVTMPLSMGAAVSAHSNVIRRAAWSHYGFVVGQEGDSFILAFRDACDAVAFCLQVRSGPQATCFL